MQFAVVLCFISVIKIATMSYSNVDCKSFCSEPGNRTDGIGECEMSGEDVDYTNEFKLSCCFFTRMDPIIYHWYVDGHQIDTDEGLKDDVLFTNNSRGSYLSFPRQRVGQIFKKSTLNVTCKAITSKGERSQRILINSKNCSYGFGEPRVIADPESVEVLEGDAVQLKCTTFANVDGSITWEINGPNGERRSSSKYEIVTQTNDSLVCGNVKSTLRIQNVHKDDFGAEFKCMLFLPMYYAKVSDTAIIMGKEIEIITIERYGLTIGMFIALSLLAVILAISAYAFRRELLQFINNKIANHPYHEMFGLH